MKKAMEVIVQVKFVWGLFFAASVIIYTIINMLLGNTSIELIAVWQLLLLTIVIVFIHYLIFGEFILTDLSIKKKIFIHFPLCYLTILVFINLYGWINITSFNTILTFSGIYLFFYLSIVNSLYLYYKITGEELNAKLAIYKQNKKSSK
ncbi:hypothetical protein CLHOM_29210 [Clostridium homopropionicum DSM 5847]|uniref:DUF3021 family protein n=1 Tax=Clostridium homopropionicum DSM 5847 TaxID=1121318 RepID=A0A0L6Z6P3_9CLOT|nr:DUF3021 family protein [Clostridium homopropionicum]KOA18637.1 hypothetical protein CLHOM_29210 [Clostridium homopropionicum DSM 5847]SFG50910.1 Protein of unknown function [Clostridium homopropionicum]